MTGIIDYGLGNLSSIRNMLNKVGAESAIVNNSGRSPYAVCP